MKSKHSDALMKKVFGETLKEIRAEQGVTQDQLSAKSGMDRSYVGQLERGLKGPTIMTVFLYAKGMGVAPSDIIRRMELNLANASEIF